MTLDTTTWPSQPVVLSKPVSAALRFPTINAASNSRKAGIKHPSLAAAAAARKH